MGLTNLFVVCVIKNIMNGEEKLLSQIFGEKNNQWKNKYEISYCNLCDCFIIACPVCKNSSCNGSGCKECFDDFNEFSHEIKHRITDYLDESEKLVYQKTKQLKKFMLHSLGSDEKQIDFKKLAINGYMSQDDQDLFWRELK